jgi:hypothetical protein
MAGPLADRFPGLTLLRQLGSGASGSVYLALQQDLGRQVALKVMGGALLETPDFRERFAREARTMAENPHPALVPIFSAELEADPAYFTMAFMPGGDLAPCRRADGRLSPAQLVAAGRRVAEALAHLHAQGVLHRDVKPENLFRDEDGQVCLGDLGLGFVERDPALTATGVVVGTPNYMAPELFEGRSYAPGTDLYALAATLFELATGELPRVWPEVYCPVEVDDERLGVPGLAGILMRCLRVEPVDRWDDAAAVAEALAEVQARLAEAPVTSAVDPVGATATVTLEIEDAVAASSPGSATESEGGLAPPPVAAPSRLPVLLALGVFAAAAVIGAREGRLVPPPVEARGVGEGRWVLSPPGGETWELVRVRHPPAGRAEAQEELRVSRAGETRLLQQGPPAEGRVGFWGDGSGVVVTWEEAHAASTVLAVVPQAGPTSFHQLEGTGWRVSGLDRDTIDLARFDRRHRLPRGAPGEDDVQRDP